MARSKMARFTTEQNTLQDLPRAGMPQISNTEMFPDFALHQELVDADKYMTDAMHNERVVRVSIDADHAALMPLDQILDSVASQEGLITPKAAMMAQQLIKVSYTTQERATDALRLVNTSLESICSKSSESVAADLVANINIAKESIFSNIAGMMARMADAIMTFISRTFKSVMYLKEHFKRIQLKAKLIDKEAKLKKTTMSIVVDKISFEGKTDPKSVETGFENLGKLTHYLGKNYITSAAEFYKEMTQVHTDYSNGFMSGVVDAVNGRGITKKGDAKRAEFNADITKAFKAWEKGYNLDKVLVLPGSLAFSLLKDNDICVPSLFMQIQHSTAVKIIMGVATATNALDVVEKSGVGTAIIGGTAGYLISSWIIGGVNRLFNSQLAITSGKVHEGAKDTFVTFTTPDVNQVVSMCDTAIQCCDNLLAMENALSNFTHTVKTEANDQIRKNLHWSTFVMRWFPDFFSGSTAKAISRQALSDTGALECVSDCFKVSYASLRSLSTYLNKAVDSY